MSKQIALEEHECCKILCALISQMDEILERHSKNPTWIPSIEMGLEVSSTLASFARKMHNAGIKYAGCYSVEQEMNRANARFQELYYKR